MLADTKQANTYACDLPSKRAFGCGLWQTVSWNPGREVQIRWERCGMSKPGPPGRGPQAQRPWP